MESGNLVQTLTSIASVGGLRTKGAFWATEGQGSPEEPERYEKILRESQFRKSMEKDFQLASRKFCSTFNRLPMGKWCRAQVVSRRMQPMMSECAVWGIASLSADDVVPMVSLLDHDLLLESLHCNCLNRSTFHVEI